MKSNEARLLSKPTSEDDTFALADEPSERPGPLDLTPPVEPAPLVSCEPLRSGQDQVGSELSVGVEEWMEVQLLDCQNLARQNGYIELAALLDEALDQLARVVAGCGASA